MRQRSRIAFPYRGIGAEIFRLRFYNPVSHQTSLTSFSPLVTWPIVLISIILFLSDSVWDSSQMIIIPIPILKVRNISLSETFPSPCIIPKIGSSGQVPRFISTETPLGRIRGMFSRNPPPVMWARPLINGARTPSSVLVASSSNGPICGRNDWCVASRLRRRFCLVRRRRNHTCSRRPRRIAFGRASSRLSVSPSKECPERHRPV